MKRQEELHLAELTATAKNDQEVIAKLHKVSSCLSVHCLSLCIHSIAACMSDHLLVSLHGLDF